MPRASIVLTAAVLATACGGSPDPAADEVLPPAVDTAAVAPTAAPVDSVLVWAGDIRDGIAPLPGQVEADPTTTRQRAVELYVSRQERIEQTVGPGMGSAPDLAEAVHEAEAHFHELMQLLGETPPPDSIRVAAAVRALDAQIAEVQDLVRSPARAADAAGSP